MSIAYTIYNEATGKVLRSGSRNDQAAIAALALPPGSVLLTGARAIPGKQRVADGQVLPLTEAELASLAAAQAAKEAARPVEIRPRHFLLLLRAARQAGVALPQELLDLLAAAAARNQ